MFRTFFFLLFFYAVAVDNAHAYIDFGTGSYILQIVAASAIGFVFFIKNYLSRIKQIFARKTASGEAINEKSYTTGGKPAA
jgi:hypothetical protein